MAHIRIRVLKGKKKKKKRDLHWLLGLICVCRKIKSEKENTVIDGSRDIISTLPDELICHILSFLPTKEAASTSVLSKRWKLLFAFVPNLDFDESLCFHPATSYKERRNHFESFRHFVDRVLALQGKLKVPLNRFSLKCKHGGYVIHDCSVSLWISKVLKRDVLDLYISLSGYPGYSLPSAIFVSKTLVKLKIVFRYCVNINIDSVSCLPKLKTLHLDYFRIETNTFNKLLSGCHALEELVLVDLRWHKYTESGRCPVTLSIPTLKRLMFYRSLRVRYEDKERVSMSFDNPNLVYLEYSDDIVDRFEQVSFESLVEAKLRLENAPDQIETDKITVTKLFIGIRNVKILYLSDDTLKVLACYRDAIPVFGNLIELTIKTSTYVTWELFPYLLKSCPSLQSLVFEELRCKYDVVWRLVKMDVCTFLSSSKVKVLKILNLGKYDGDHCHRDDPDGYCREDHVVQHQIQCVKLFLETMPDLEQVILYYNTSVDEDVMEVFKKLEKLPRVASANCNIQLKSDNLSLSSTLTKQGTLL